MQDNEIRAIYDSLSIRVYQAYSAEIALPALDAKRFVPPFKMNRMTWIKPSFNWMMYRSGYASKPGQEFILGIDVTREGFAWALKHSAMSNFEPSIYESHQQWRRELAIRPVRIQWDPERDWKLGTLNGRRTIQIGLSGEAVSNYVNKWIINIEDVTHFAHLAATARNSAIPPVDLPCDYERAYPALSHADEPPNVTF